MRLLLALLALMVASSSALAQSDDRCAKREPCREDGRCTARGDECVVGSSEDCRRSFLCTKKGRCTLIGDECAATSAEDCRSSGSCLDKGQCILNSESHRCDDGNDVDEPVLYSGVAVSSLGGLAVVAGVVVLGLSAVYCDLWAEPEDGGSCITPLGPALIAAGAGAALAIGMPMIIVGAEGHPRGAIVVGPQGAQLRWHF